MKITQEYIDNKRKELEKYKADKQAILSSTVPIQDKINELERDLAYGIKELEVQKISPGNCLYTQQGEILIVEKYDPKKHNVTYTNGSGDSKSVVYVRGYKIIRRHNKVGLFKTEWSSTNTHPLFLNAKIIPLKVFKKVEKQFESEIKTVNNIITEFAKLDIIVQLHSGSVG